MTAAADRTPLDIGDLTVDQLPDVARGGRPIAVSPEALARVAAGRLHIEDLAGRPEPTYGVSTGFGALATVAIAPERRAALQVSLTRSHAAGIGALVEPATVRAMMALRLHTLSTGRTGVRPEVVTALAGLLNAGIIPAVHEFGSLGCSGDLSPLAHVAIVLQGEGQVVSPDGTTRPAAQALAEAGLTPVVLAEKEGLALINGTDGMLGMLALALADLEDLLRIADITTAMSVEALLGTDRAYAADLVAMRPHPGQAASAANLRRLLAGSRDRGQPPPRHDPPRPGRVLDAMRTPGGRLSARHHGPRTRRRRAGAGLDHRQPGHHRSMAASSPTATSTAPRWPTSWTSWPSPWPMWPRSASGAPIGSWTARATRAFLPSWPTRSGWTPAT